MADRRPKLGMNMLLWSTDVSGPEHDSTFEMLLDAGYDGVEIPIFDDEVDKYERLGERLGELGLTALGVTARTADTSPISSDPEVRARGLEATSSAVDACAVLGARTLCGPIEAPLGEFSGSAPTADERKRSVESLRAAAEYAATRDVTLVVEYLNRFEMYLVNCAADAAALVREVDHPNCRLMYDTFHAHIEEADPRAALRACADVLVHFHASENHRGTPGSGQVDWDTTFAGLAEIDYDGWVVVEAFGDSLPELAAATKVWRRTFTSEEQLARDGAAFLRPRVQQLVV
ncbi:MAG: sugar phosphate isomerase/epimerase family protein [Gaiellaceae bacterium]